MVDDCRSNKAESMARLRAKRRAVGLCWECPAAAFPGHIRCLRCIERKRLRRKVGLL